MQCYVLAGRLNLRTQLPVCMCVVVLRYAVFASLVSGIQHCHEKRATNARRVAVAPAMGESAAQCSVTAAAMRCPQ